MKVVISIPAYNEACCLEETIRYIREVMDATQYSYLIHVQDDGSCDDTVKIAQENADVVHVNSYNMGLAITFRNEIEHCLQLEADIIVHIDADGQYDPRHIPYMISRVESGYDLVIGSRFLHGNR